MALAPSRAERALVATGYALSDALNRMREDPSDEDARAEYVRAKVALTKGAEGLLAPVSH